MSVSGVSVITDNLMHGWGLPICAWSSLASQERLSNRPRCTTTQHVSPPASPSGLGTLAEDFRGTTWFRSGQSGEELASFGRPSSCHFHPRQPSDIFHLPPTTPGKFGPCASSQHSLSAAPSLVAAPALVLKQLSTGPNWRSTPPWCHPPVIIG